MLWRPQGTAFRTGWYTWHLQGTRGAVLTSCENVTIHDPVRHYCAGLCGALHTQASESRRLSRYKRQGDTASRSEASRRGPRPAPPRFMNSSYSPAPVYGQPRPLFRFMESPDSRPRLRCDPKP